jgi:hypothetical protein
LIQRNSRALNLLYFRLKVQGSRHVAALENGRNKMAIFSA